MDFKHEGYHNVNCISKELGYRNNRGTRRRRCIPEFLLFRGVRLVGGVWVPNSRCHKRAHPILRWTLLKSWFTFHYWFPFGRKSNPLQQSWGTTHKRIGSTQVDHKRSQLATKGLDHKRSQEHRLGSNDPRVTRSRTFISTNPRGESKPTHQNAMARTQEVLKSFTLKSQQKQLMLVGGEERKNKEELNKWNSKIKI